MIPCCFSGCFLHDDQADFLQAPQSPPVQSSLMSSSVAIRRSVVRVHLISFDTADTISQKRTALMTSSSAVSYFATLDTSVLYVRKKKKGNPEMRRRRRHHRSAPVVNPAAVSAAVNVGANFVISQNVNPEADSAMQTRLEVLSKNNAVLGVQ